MSHEIRTPLNGVMGMATMLEGTELTQAQKRALDIIKSSGKHLLSMLNDVLDLSKIEADQLELEDVEFQLRQVIETARDLHAPIAEAAGLSIELSVEPSVDLDSDRLGDPTRIAQVFHNLLSNAVKFTSEGRIKVTVSQDASSDELIVDVHDTGCGMTPVQLEKVFQPFTQADASTTRRFGGTGLGLSISRRLANAMGGSLTAKSEPSVGSNFRFTFPAPLVARRRAQADDVAAPSDDHAAGLRILVVDDSETNRLVAATLLRPIEADVTLAEGGEHAVQLYRPGQFDLILMDIRMPVMDGFETLSEIRRIEADAATAQTPVIAMTANVMGAQLAQYQSAGFADYMAKPVDQARLLAMVRTISRPS